MNTHLIAPCGMNCGICMAYLRDKNICFGCWNEDENKRNHCKKCSIRNCSFLLETDSKFCYECAKFPCARLKQLDKRYRLKYHMSMIENLKNIEKDGLESFVLQEKERWKCENCGGTVCVHTEFCLSCRRQGN